MDENQVKLRSRTQCFAFLFLAVFCLFVWYGAGYALKKPVVGLVGVLFSVGGLASVVAFLWKARCAALGTLLSAVIGLVSILLLVSLLALGVMCCLPFFSIPLGPGD